MLKNNPDLKVLLHKRSKAALHISYSLMSDSAATGFQLLIDGCRLRLQPHKLVFTVEITLSTSNYGLFFFDISKWE